MTGSARLASAACAMLLSACTEPPLEMALGQQVALLDSGRFRVVDLTHPFDEQTVYWPTAPHAFELETLAFGETDDGYFYSAMRFCTPEHGGTHLDAPIHFHRDGSAADEVPLERLIGAAVVIDVREEAAAARDYRLTPERIAAFEAEHGRIPEDAIVLLRTGWSDYWPDRAAYLGDDTAGDASNLSFPSYGEAAARLLVEERGVAVLGVDTASIDYGRSQDFIVHRIAAAAGVPGLENLTRLDELPATGAFVVAMPMKIAGGSGGPVRVAALLAEP
jgi:kynurenine formamidase